jgi:hypothetical protein
VNAALNEVVQERRRLELVSLPAEDGRFDFDLAEEAWGSNQ